MYEDPAHLTYFPFWVGKELVKAHMSAGRFAASSSASPVLTAAPGAAATEPMAGSRRRRRLHRRELEERPPPLPPCSEEPTSQRTTALREIAVAERPSKKTCHASSSTSTTTSGSDVWADLLDSLLHQIIALLSSFHDLLAFIGTCHSWRAALSSLPPAFSFNCPPLHLQTDISYPHPRHSYIEYNHLSNIKWQLTDPAKRTSSLRCSAPQNLRGCMRYLGCSYGYLIFSNLEQCILVDAYCGADVRPPKRKSSGFQEIYYGILVAALNSPNSQLLLFSFGFMFQWQVGTNSWLHHPFDGEPILQIVSFKGVIFAMDMLQRLHRICLAPSFSMQEVAVVWEEGMGLGLDFKPWLVVCGDMLLLVDLSANIDVFPGTFKVFRLEFSVEPAKWVKVDNLGNTALFISFDRRNPTFSSTSPERWGGKSNCIYLASGSEHSDEAWIMVELGQAVPSESLWDWCKYSPILFPGPGDCGYQPQNLWVLPSFVYGIGK